MSTGEHLYPSDASTGIPTDTGSEAALNTGAPLGEGTSPQPETAAPARREGLLPEAASLLDAGPCRPVRGGTAAIQYILNAMVKAHTP